jgi:phosphatidylserine/phosphatidylglycerophosphate/cardiolipin synthase-like enzyme
MVVELETWFEGFWRDQGGDPCPQGPDPQVTSPAPNATGRLLQTGPFDHQIQRELYRAVDSARHHVYVENFTLSDSRLLCRLAQARRRGVDVRVVLTVSACPNVINRTNRVTVNRMLRAGIRVYVYPNMTHVKAATVDGCWAYLGTGNFDPLSMRHNRELGVALGGQGIVAEVETRLFRPVLCSDCERTAPFTLGCADYWWELVSSICL